MASNSRWCLNSTVKYKWKNSITIQMSWPSSLARKRNSETKGPLCRSTEGAFRLRFLLLGWLSCQKKAQHTAILGNSMSLLRSKAFRFSFFLARVLVCESVAENDTSLLLDNDTQLHLSPPSIPLSLPLRCPRRLYTPLRSISTCSHRFPWTTTAALHQHRTPGSRRQPHLDSTLCIRLDPYTQPT